MICDCNIESITSATKIAAYCPTLEIASKKTAKNLHMFRKKLENGYLTK